MSITVYIWRTSANNVGHASMQCDGTYVSFWPGEEAGKKDFKKAATHEAAFPSRYRTDVRLEGCESDVAIRLDGLDEPAICKAWNEMKDRMVRYNMVNQNCSTVVANLLETGSGIAPPFVPKVKINEHVPQNKLLALSMRLRYFGNTISMWSPDEVLRYAEHIKHRKVVCT